MVTREKQNELKEVIGEALTNRLRFLTIVKRFVYTSSTGAVTISQRRLKQALADPELAVTAEAVTDASGSEALLANVESLRTDTSTSWASNIQSLCGCQFPAPTVSSSVRDGDTTGTDENKPACASGCVAGVVVGGVAAVSAGVGAVAYTQLKKPPTSVQPDGAGSGSAPNPLAA
jgi:hypothetical protein